MSGPRLIVLATDNPGKARELEALLSGNLRTTEYTEHTEAGKAREVEALLSGLVVRFALLKDVAGSVEIPEPFATFHENAAYKAAVAAGLSGEWALGEDSGLVVDALGGRPGVYSARFAGKAESDQRRVELLLKMLEGTPVDGRAARFHCAIALASSAALLGEWKGVCEGRIAEAPRGEGGFGFDPVFIVEGEARTNAELAPEEKNAISHRGVAMRSFAADLPALLARKGG